MICSSNAQARQLGNFSFRTDAAIFSPLSTFLSHLNSRFLNADEALENGLVNRVVPVELYLEEAIELASQIAERAPVAIRLAKEAVNAAYEMTLQAGLAHERRLFYMLFATEDQKEGMEAFLQKRRPNWKGR